MARSLGDIIDALKDGAPVDHDDLRYAVLALSALHYFAHASLIRLQEYPDSKVITLDSEIEEAFRRDKDAFATPPKAWVGWNNDPANPAYQRFRATGKKLIDKVTGV
jgi:hypothetical protein